MSTPEEQLRAAGEPADEEELRAAYEAELARITTSDMIAQATVSLLNLGARRLVPAGRSQAPGGAGAAAQDAATAGQDLEQARDAIDAASALLEILARRVPQQELAPLKDALSQLQMAYARELRGASAQTPAQQGARAQEPAASGAPPASQGAGEQGGQPEGDQSRRPGPAESSGRLWVPGS